MIFNLLLKFQKIYIFIGPITLHKHLKTIECSSDYQSSI